MADEDLVEPIAVTDVYADGVASVELISEVNVRITYFAHMHVEGGPSVRVVCARIVRPRSSVGAGQVKSMLAKITPKSSGD